MKPKQQINKINLAQEIWQTLTTAISETAELEVTTYLENGDLELAATSAAGTGFQTRIDLFEQTVVHEIEHKLIDNPAYRELQRWHIEQVRQRQDSLSENLASLETMRQLVLDPDYA